MVFFDWRLPIFPRPFGLSIFGSTAFHFSVRDGKRCCHCDTIARFIYSNLFKLEEIQSCDYVIMSQLIPIIHRTTLIHGGF